MLRWYEWLYSPRPSDFGLLSGMLERLGINPSIALVDIGREDTVPEASILKVSIGWPFFRWIVIFLSSDRLYWTAGFSFLPGTSRLRCYYSAGVVPYPRQMDTRVPTIQNNNISKDTKGEDGEGSRSSHLISPDRPKNGVLSAEELRISLDPRVRGYCTLALFHL